MHFAARATRALNSNRNRAMATNPLDFFATVAATATPVANSPAAPADGTDTLVTGAETMRGISRGARLLRQGYPGFPRRHPPLGVTDIDWTSASHSAPLERKYPLQTNDLDHPSSLEDLFKNRTVLVDVSPCNFHAVRFEVDELFQLMHGWYAVPRRVGAPGDRDLPPLPADRF